MANDKKLITYIIIQAHLLINSITKLRINISFFTKDNFT